MHIETVNTDELREIMSKKLDMSDELIAFRLFDRYREKVIIAYMYYKERTYQDAQDLVLLYKKFEKDYDECFFSATNNALYVVVDITSIKS
jgi:hypothetical protein